MNFAFENVFKPPEYVLELPWGTGIELYYKPADDPDFLKWRGALTGVALELQRKRTKAENLAVIESQVMPENGSEMTPEDRFKKIETRSNQLYDEFRKEIPDEVLEKDNLIGARLSREYLIDEAAHLLDLSRGGWKGVKSEKGKTISCTLKAARQFFAVNSIIDKEPHKDQRFGVCVARLVRDAANAEVAVEAIKTQDAGKKSERATAGA